MHWIVLQLIVTLALSVSVSSSQELNSTLRLTEYGVPYAFVGETITFTCQTERSNSIGWSSKEYIGVNRVDFASVEPDGTTRPPTESGAIAQLISSYRVNGTVILVSQLRITVQSVYQIASVTCHNIGIDTVDTSSFRMADNTSITCDAPAICPGEKVSCACITAHSNTLAWSSDQLIGNGGIELAFNLNEPLPARQNASNMNTSAVLSGTSDENGVIVLKSELSFVLLSTPFSIILTCENVDHQNSYSVILPMYEEGCPTATSDSADPTTTMDESNTIISTTISTGGPPTLSDATGVSGSIIVVSVFLSVFTVMAVLLVPILISIRWKTSRNGKLICWKRQLQTVRPRVLKIKLDLQETSPYDNKSQSIQDEGTLVYADIGQRPAPSKSKINSHLLDDNRVEYALLDHHAQKPKVSTLQESSAANTSDNCPSVNLDNLLVQLRPQVGPKWYQFGEAAGIEKEALDKIAECPPDQCIIELFDYWLRFSTEPPTWRTVADILKAINLIELGRDIEKVYTTGALPIEVDMNRVPKLDSQEDEPPPPLPTRSGNFYIDAPPHTSQDQKPRVAPPEQEDKPYMSVSAPKPFLPVTVKPKMATESGTGGAFPSISTTRGMDSMLTTSPFELKPLLSFTTDNLEQEILTLEKGVSDLRRQIQQLIQELSEKVEELERKQNELKQQKAKPQKRENKIEQQQKAGLRVHVQNTEIDDNITGMYPIQVSEANKDSSSVEANMAWNQGSPPRGPRWKHEGQVSLTKV